MRTSTDIRARVHLLVPVHVPLLRFTRAFTCVCRKVDVLGLSLPADVLALAVCVELASNMPVLNDVQLKVLQVFPDADVKSVLGASAEDNILRMTTEGYVRVANPEENTLLLLMQAHQPPGMFWMDWVLGNLYNRFLNVPKLKIREIAACFHYRPYLVGTVLEHNRAILEILKKRRRSDDVLSVPLNFNVPHALTSELKALDAACAVAASTVSSFCAVCLEDSPDPRTCGDPTCKCVTCRDCLEKFVITEMNASLVATRRCVRPGCSGVYADSDLEQVLGLHYKKFVRMELAQTLATSTWSCTCGSMSTLDGDCPPVITCPSCKRMSCTQCGEDITGHHVCVTSAQRRTARMTEAMTEAIVRQCACGNRFVKEDGCNKMTCPCGKKMCYICRAVITSYSHFCSCGKNDTCSLCHIYTDASKRDEAALALVASSFTQE